MRRVGVVASALVIAGCGSGGGAGTDAGAGDASVIDGAGAGLDAAAPDATSADAGPPDVSTLPSCKPISPPVDNTLGGALQTLSQNTGSDPDLGVGAFWLSPDSARVVFRGDPEVDGVRNLYSVPIGGGQVVPLTDNAGPAPSGFFAHVVITPDGSTVVWSGLKGDDTTRLHAVPIGGGTTTTVSPDTGSPADGNVVGFALSPDGATAVFLRESENGARRLYSAPVAGGAVTPLSPDPGSNGDLDVHTYAVSPDGSRVAFMGDVEGEGLERVYSVPIDGGTLSRLSPDDGDDPELGSGAGSEIFVTPGGARVIFSGAFVVPGQHRVYSAPLDGGPPVQLSPDVGVSDLRDFRAIGVGAGPRAVLRGDHNGDGEEDLFAVEAQGGEVAMLSPDLDLTGFDYDVALTPDGTALVFTGITQPEGVKRIHSVPLGGGMPTQVSRNTLPSPSLAAYFPRVSPDSGRVAYLGDAETDGIDRAYVACIDGTEQVTLSPNDGTDPDLGYSALRLEWTPDGRHLFFVGDMITDDLFELYRATATTGDPVTAASNVRPVGDLEVSPDGKWVVFMTDSGGVVRLQSRGLP